MSQTFHACQICGKGRLLAPDVYCLNPSCQRHGELEKLEEQLEAGEINEGQYLIEMNRLKDGS